MMNSNSPQKGPVSTPAANSAKHANAGEPNKGDPSKEKTDDKKPEPDGNAAKPAAIQTAGNRT